ncbi:hypothetical protein FHS27_002503 [Rhodopirellula rubra]|uniref:Uncharacterized protein n=1 Tax=Aporhodopirellula rubra TaxID=980271 RepID=A0A7W5H6B0_9BACT|nr:hypothetical protein [Aporhodopirellula rubra]MBB3206691.1 hypothetical protein [Aporhodopirellula rubra]
MIKFSHKKTYILPGYVPTALWNEEALENQEIEFQHGIHSGGIFYRDVTAESEDEDLDLFVINQLWRDAIFECRVGPTDFANKMSTLLRKSAISLEPPRVPKIAERYGYTTTKFRRPTCFVTPESVDGLKDEMFLAIAPRAKKQRFGASQFLLEQLGAFAITCVPVEALPSICVRELPWLTEGRSNWVFFSLHFKMETPSEILLSCLIHCIEAIDSLHQKISVAHVFADFEGNPRVREFWTSPPA